jgi:hypothetical protein
MESVLWHVSSPETPFSPFLCLTHCMDEKNRFEIFPTQDKMFKCLFARPGDNPIKKVSLEKGKIESKLFDKVLPMFKI